MKLAKILIPIAMAVFTVEAVPVYMEPIQAVEATPRKGVGNFLAKVKAGRLTGTAVRHALVKARPLCGDVSFALWGDRVS